MTAWAARAIRWGAVAAVAATVLGGCTLRAEAPPLERRTPSPDVVVRDLAAAREQAVLDAAAAEESTLATVSAANALAHLDVLGPVYVETPGATPSPSAAPTLEDAVLAARDGALADADSTEDPSLAILLRATALSHSLAGAAAEFGGTAWPATSERTAGVGDLGDSLLPAPDSALDADTLASLAQAHDRAAFAYEVAAARSADDERTAWLERSALHRTRAQEILDQTRAEDLRTDLYDVAPAQVADAEARLATARDIETALGEDYAALMVAADPEDRGWLFNAAFDAYAEAFSLPGFSTVDVPALPGAVAAP